MELTSCELLVGEEISGERREIVRTSIRIALSTRAVELHSNDWTTPLFLSSSGSDVEDRPVDRTAFLERLRCIPNMKGKSQRFAIKALCQDNRLYLVVTKIRV